MFVFQCMVGCRHSDLVTFTPKNIIDGVLEYIPIKTKGKLGDVVRVPLIPKAMAILDGHDHGDDEPIFPKHYNFKFNDAIRRILKRAKVNRVVTVINPKTRLEEKKPISDVATSHLHEGLLSVIFTAWSKTLIWLLLCLVMPKAALLLPDTESLMMT